MVEIANNNGVTALESMISVSEEIASVVNNPDNVKLIRALQKDLHLKHRLEEKDGEYTSIVGRIIGGHRDAKRAISTIEEDHIAFLSKLEDRIERPVKEPGEIEDMIKALASDFPEIFGRSDHYLIIIPA